MLSAFNELHKIANIVIANMASVLLGERKWTSHRTNSCTAQIVKTTIFYFDTKISEITVVDYLVTACVLTTLGLVLSNSCYYGHNVWSWIIWDRFSVQTHFPERLMSPKLSASSEATQFFVFLLICTWKWKQQTWQSLLSPHKSFSKYIPSEMARARYVSCLF